MEKLRDVTVEDVKVDKGFEITKHEMFNIVKGPRGYFIAINNKIVCSRLFDTIEAAKKYINKKPWDLMVNTACVCFELMQEEKQSQTNK